MNRRIRRVGLVVAACFVALFVQLNYLQVVAADRLASDPRNVRRVLRDYSRPRGDIVTADGEVVAHSVPSADEFKLQRTYPTGELFGHVSGFFSFNLGLTAVEDAYNGDLAGRTARSVSDLGDLLVGKEPTGTVILSITKAGQEAARAALGGRRGSVVALDPTTGEVLALWSEPAYDPNPLAGHQSKAVQAAFERNRDDPTNPMLARAYRERYPPGSTFKVVTAATALETGTATPDTGFPVLRSLKLPQSNRVLRNFGSKSCGGSLAESFRVSCNTTFAQLGLTLEEKLVGGVQAFGIGEDVPFDLKEARSTGPGSGTFRRDKPSFAQAAIGQGNVFVTPLQMAMVAGAIANDGVLMKPHVAREVQDPDGEVVRSIGAERWKRAVSAETAEAVKAMMIEVVRRGTGSAASVPGVTVAGKTGTAQAPGGPPHAWFIAFAPADAPRVAIAVIVERGGDLGDEATGGRVAAPVAGQVLAKLLSLSPPAQPKKD